MNRKTFLILFCTIFSLESLFPNFEISELAQLPEVWAHYQFHQSRAPRTTFAAFLRLHYDGDSKHWSQDTTAHNRLPFSKRHQHHVKQVLYSSTLADNTLQGSILLMAIGDVWYCPIHNAITGSPIWQPPRS